VLFFMENILLNMTADKPRLIFVPIDKVVPNQYQPRRNFDSAKLYELSESIKEHGIVQPLTVKQVDKELYELIAGERRLRAAKLVGLKTVPVIVKKYTREDSMVLALIENIQRHDLGFFEEALSYKKLIDECQLTQEELALKLGKTQSSVANKLRLLKLEPHLRALISEHSLSERHARCLLKLEDTELREKVINAVISGNLNVAQTEAFILEVTGEIKREAKKKHNRLKRVSLFKDLRIFSSTINQTVELIRQSGLSVKSDKKETEDFIEYVIRVDKKST